MKRIMIINIVVIILKNIEILCKEIYKLVAIYPEIVVKIKKIKTDIKLLPGIARYFKRKK